MNRMNELSERDLDAVAGGAGSIGSEANHAVAQAIGHIVVGQVSNPRPQAPAPPPSPIAAAAAAAAAAVAASRKQPRCGRKRR